MIASNLSSANLFLTGNQLELRWGKLTDFEHFTIVETNFDCGLNFLSSWQLWLQSAPQNTRLHFVSCDAQPLSRQGLIDALKLFPELTELSNQLIESYPLHLSTGLHRLIFGQVTLTLIINNDANAALSQLIKTPHPLFGEHNRIADAWFLNNSDAWSVAQLEPVAQLSKANATLVCTEKNSTEINSAAALSQLGFNETANTQANHILTATFCLPAKPGISEFSAGAFNSPYPQTWHLAPITDTGLPTNPTLRTAMIIGGGLAGCHIARLLAERGFKVQILERHRALAQGGSGNPQGMLYAKLSPNLESLSSFNLSSMLFAQKHYEAFWRDAPSVEINSGQHCGVLQIAHTEKEATLHKKLQAHFSTHYPDSTLIEFVDSARASEIAGVTIEHSAVFFPKAGWLSPQAVCRQLCKHANIELLTACDVEKLERKELQWQASNNNGELLAQAHIAIIASASDAKNLAQTSYLPLKPIRGQVSYLPATKQSRALKTVVCGEGYLSPATTDSEIAPAHNGIGASFNLHNHNLDLTEQDHQLNLDNLFTHAPKLKELFSPLAANKLSGRAAFRCTTPDYLPLLGAVPVESDFIEKFALLRKNAQSSILELGRYHPQLYLSVGYGSRGLAYTPLAAEFLAAQICGEPLPMESRYLQALHPARFIVRGLVRNKI